MPKLAKRTEYIGKAFGYVGILTYAPTLGAKVQDQTLQ